ncbi:MAG: HD domain-containing protein [Acidobacteria bacterium]|nr:MAG: HD domain-containing protein [Acidobacteriota bacterium]
MSDQRLQQQIAFALEIDRLKTVLRRTAITDRSRQENSAEHSWHVAMMALLLAEYAPPGLDVGRVVRMLLVHDLVEIDAGDTFCYDADAVAGQAAREAQAAARLFALLPADQAAELRALWDEFEARQTPEARFARALDCLQAVLLNVNTGGHSWRRHGVSRRQVRERVQLIADGAPALWPLVEGWIEDAAAKGWIGP